MRPSDQRRRLMDEFHTAGCNERSRILLAVAWILRGEARPELDVELNRDAVHAY